MDQSFDATTTLLDTAVILDWTPGRLTVGIPGIGDLNITQQAGILRVDQPRIAFACTPMTVPIAEADAECLALLPCAEPFWQATAEATLVRARQVMQAHCALIPLYSDVALDALLREHPDVAIAQNGFVRIYIRSDSRSCVAHIHDPVIGGTHLPVQNPRLFQATCSLSCADDGIWRGQRDTVQTYSLVYPDLSTRHAKMALLATLDASMKHVDARILPLLVS